MPVPVALTPQAADRANRQPSRAGRNLPMAVLVGGGLGVAVLASLLIRKEAFVALAGAAIVLGAWELGTAMRRRDLQVPLIPVAVGSVGMMVSAFVAGEEGLLAAFTFTSLGVLLWRLSEGGTGAARDVAAGVFVAAYVPFLAGFSAVMLAQPDGARRVLLYVATVVASDVGGYAAGVLLGRHPMAPTVSPKKSWEGFAGSVLVCTLVSGALVSTQLGGPMWLGLVLGPAVALSATLGDLSESLLKRDLGVKDLGSVLPGHGGLMDRLDSLVFTAPVVHLLLTLLLTRP